MRILALLLAIFSIGCFSCVAVSSVVLYNHDEDKRSDVSQYAPSINSDALIQSKVDKTFDLENAVRDCQRHSRLASFDALRSRAMLNWFALWLSLGLATALPAVLLEIKLRRP